MINKFFCWLRSFSHAQWFFWGYKYFLCKFYFRALVKGAPFTQKLHLIYLVNDVLHHWWVSLSQHSTLVNRCNVIEIISFIRSVRKRADDLKNNLENIVIPMFCSGQIRMFALNEHGLANECYRFPCFQRPTKTKRLNLQNFCRCGNPRPTSLMLVWYQSCVHPPHLCKSTRPIWWTRSRRWLPQ